MAATSKKSARLQFKWEIQQNQPTAKDSFGQQVDNWTTFAEVWAEVSPMSGAEIFNAVQMQSNIRHRVRFRWRRDKRLYAGMRLRRKLGVNGQRLLNFAEDPRNVDEANFWCEVLCVEVTKPATETEEDQGKM